MCRWQRIHVSCKLFTSLDDYMQEVLCQYWDYINEFSLEVRKEFVMRKRAGQHSGTGSHRNSKLLGFFLDSLQAFMVSPYEVVIQTSGCRTGYLTFWDRSSCLWASFNIIFAVASLTFSFCSEIPVTWITCDHFPSLQGNGASGVGAGVALSRAAGPEPGTGLCRCGHLALEMLLYPQAFK